MAHEFCHVELLTGDVGKAKKFYKGLFGWDLEDLSIGNGQIYTAIKPGSGPGGGMMMKPEPQIPTGWFVYVNVKDLKKSVKKAAKLGAKVINPGQPVPGWGAFAVLVDPTGAVINLWEAKRKTKKKK